MEQIRHDNQAGRIRGRCRLWCTYNKFHNFQTHLGAVAEDRARAATLDGQALPEMLSSMLLCGEELIRVMQALERLSMLSHLGGVDGVDYPSISVRFPSLPFCV